MHMQMRAHAYADERTHAAKKKKEKEKTKKIGFVLNASAERLERESSAALRAAKSMHSMHTSIHAPKRFLILSVEPLANGGRIQKNGKK